MSNPSNPYGYNGDDNSNPAPAPQQQGHNSSYSIPPQQGYPQSPYAGPGNAPVPQGTEMLATNPEALSQSYWAIGLAGLSSLLGMIAFFVFFPMFLIPLASIPGLIISISSNRKEKNNLARIAFWVNLVSLIISSTLILGVILLIGLFALFGGTV